MKFKVGDVIQIKGNYKHFRPGMDQWKVVVMEVKYHLFKPNKYKVLSLNFGKMFNDKIGPDGLEINFYKTGTATEQEMSILRKLYD